MDGLEVGRVFAPEGGEEAGIEQGGWCGSWSRGVPRPCWLLSGSLCEYTRIGRDAPQESSELLF